MSNSILTKVLKILIIFVLCAIGYYLITLSLSFLMPLFIAVLVALIIEPGVGILEKKLKLPRPLASIMLLILLLVLIVGSLFLMATELYEGMAYLAVQLPQQLKIIGVIADNFFHAAILPFYESVLSLFNRLNMGESLFFQENIRNLFGYFAEQAGLFFQNLLLAIPSALIIIPESFTILLFIFLASILLSADFPRIKQSIKKYTPGKIYNSSTDLMHYLKQSVAGFIKAQFILVTISFHIIFIGFLLLQIEHALTIALLLIVIDLIPYIGTGIVFISWMLYTFFTGDYPLTIGLAVVYATVILVRQLTEPKILSVNIGVHPLAWLVAVFIGFKVWGVVGLFITPFLIVIIKALYHAGIYHALLKYIKS